jgi:hypothetical protein
LAFTRANMSRMSPEVTCLGSAPLAAGAAPACAVSLVSTWAALARSAATVQFSRPPIRPIASYL